MHSSIVFKCSLASSKQNLERKKKESEAAYITYVTSSAQVHDITCMLKAKNLFKIYLNLPNKFSLIYRHLSIGLLSACSTMSSVWKSKVIWSGAKTQGKAYVIPVIKTPASLQSDTFKTGNCISQWILPSCSKLKEDWCYTGVWSC